MSLRVEVVLSGDQEQAKLAPVHMTSNRLTIGRSDKNDLTLPDPKRVISNQHLVIEQSADGYMLVDTSTNGVRLNGNLVERGASVLLGDGDQLQVGKYKLRIETSSEPSVGPHADVFGAEADPTPDLPGSTSEKPVVDPLALLDEDGLITDDPTPFDPFPASEPDQGSEISQHMPMPRILDDESAPPPAPAQPREDIPEALRGLMAAGPAPIVADPAAMPASPPADAPVSDPFDTLQSEPQVVGSASVTPGSRPSAIPGDAAATFTTNGPAGPMGDMGPFLEGLGLKADVPLDAQRLFELGRVFALLLESFMSALAIRSRFKAEFGVARTMIQSTKNNPIKLSQSAAEALERLFVSPHQGYLGALEAAEDAVSDLATHELAMFSALKATNKAMLEQLDPDRLEAEFLRQAPQRLGLGVLSKSRFWDEYRRFFEGRLQESDPVLHFFAEGYDQAVKELEKSQSGKR